MSVHLTSHHLFIDRAYEADIQSVVEIINDAFWPSHRHFLKDNDLSRQRVTVSSIQTILQSPNDELYVLREKIGKAVIGTILLQKNVNDEPSAAKFGLLAKKTGEKYRSVKVGELLMDHVIERARGIGKSYLKIEVVSTANSEIQSFLQPLINYYKKHDFQETGKTLNFPRAHCLKEEMDIRLIEMKKDIK